MGLTEDVDGGESGGQVDHAADGGGEDAGRGVSWVEGRGRDGGCVHAAEGEEGDEAEAVFERHLELEEELGRPEVDEQVAQAVERGGCFEEGEDVGAVAGDAEGLVPEEVDWSVGDTSVTGHDFNQTSPCSGLHSSNSLPRPEESECGREGKATHVHVNNIAKKLATPHIPQYAIITQQNHQFPFPGNNLRYPKHTLIFVNAEMG